MDQYIPLSVPNFEGNERKYVEDAVSQGWVSTGGAYITRLEQRMAEFLHTEDVAACQSGTAALHLSMIEAGVEPGDYVIVSPLTFIAAVNPVRYRFADPVFIDCDDSLCLDPVKLERFCQQECRMEGGCLCYRQDGRRIRAVVVVHIFGNMADMESIMKTASRYHLKVIEDATEALGTRYTEGIYKGKYAGTIGDYGAFSFNGNKIITTGGGGAVTARAAKQVGHMRYLSTQAKDDPQFYIHNEVGYNYRMTNLQAALGVAQMEELPEFIKRKQENYQLYQAYFQDSDLCRLMPFREGVFSNHWFYSLEINRKKAGAPMRRIIDALHGQGIQTRAVWGLVHEQMPYRDAPVYKLERAIYYSQRILNIPCSTQITGKEIAYTARTIWQLLEELSNGKGRTE